MKATLKENEEKIVSVSELNNGGAGKIFLDLQKNNSEYIILKNDRPAAVLLSIGKRGIETNFNGVKCRRRYL